MWLAALHEDSGEILFMVVRHRRAPHPVGADGSGRGARLVGWGPTKRRSQSLFVLWHDNFWWGPFGRLFGPSHETDQINARRHGLSQVQRVHDGRAALH